MLRSLLMPLDGSPLAESSLPFVSRVAASSGAEVRVVTVHTPDEPDELLSNTSFQFEGVDLEEYDRRRRMEEAAYLAARADELRSQGVERISTAVLDGPVAETLSDYAAEVGADMIFMTTHGRSGVKRLWLGSVADALIRATDRPIVLLHPGCEEVASDDPCALRHVLIALDGSALSESAVRPAVDLARATGAKITLTNVISIDARYGARPIQVMGADSELRWATDYLEAAAERLRDEGCDVTVYATPGAVPAPTLSGIARELEADLIAVATQGRKGLARVILGSVADRLVQTGDRPVLMVSRGPEETRPRSF